MASTQVFRVKDLLHAYGWDFIPRLAALGINYQAEAQVLFVDSGAANALDADDGRHGHSFDVPLATIDYAIGLCTASEQSVILVAPGHVEDLAAAQIDFDVAGVACIGLGNGTLRPQIHYNNAAASVDIGANNVTLVNLGLLPSVTGVSIGVDVESGVTNFKMVDCELMMGEDGAGTDEFIKGIELKSGNHDCILENVKILAHASAAQATHGINVAAASDRLTLRNVVIDGPYATGGIVEAAAGLNHVVEDCSVDVTGTNYSFHASSTFAKRTRNLAGGVAEDTGENFIGADNSNNVVATTNVAANADGSVLEREEYIQSQIALVRTDIDTIQVGTVGVGTAYYVNSSAADDTGNGLSWATAKKTIAAAVAAAAAGDTIYIKGTAFSEAVTCNKAGMSFIGVGTGPVEATWTMVSLVDSTTDGWCLKITANAVKVENIKFRPPAYVSAGVPTAIFLGTGSDYAVIRKNRFQGRVGSYNAIYGPIPVGNVRIEDNEFLYMNTLTNGRAIYMPASAGVACSAWIIRNNRFNSCVEDINIDGRTCLLEGNIHPIVGLAADNTFGAAVTTKAVDLSGTDTGANVMTKCTLGGTYNLATYTPGTTGDVWMGNYASIVATVAPNGLTVLVPAA